MAAYKYSFESTSGPNSLPRCEEGVFKVVEPKYRRLLGRPMVIRIKGANELRASQASSSQDGPARATLQLYGNYKLPSHNKRSCKNPAWCSFLVLFMHTH